MSVWVFFKQKKTQQSKVHLVFYAASDLDKTTLPGEWQLWELCILWDNWPKKHGSLSRFTWITKIICAQTDTTWPISHWYVTILQQRNPIENKSRPLRKEGTLLIVTRCYKDGPGRIRSHGSRVRVARAIPISQWISKGTWTIGAIVTDPHTVTRILVSQNSSNNSL